MQGIIDRLAAPECARVIANNPPLLPTFQAVGIGSDFHRPSHSTGIDRIAVIVEPHEAGLGHSGWHRMEPVKRTNIGHEAGTLFFEHLPGRSVPHLWVRVGPGIGQAAILKPSVQFGIGFELRTRHEEPAPDHAHLVLNLTFLPARSGCAADIHASRQPPTGSNTAPCTCQRWRKADAAYRPAKNSPIRATARRMFS